MLPLSANSDFLSHNTAKAVNSFRDFNGEDLSLNSEIYGTNAMDQAIEALLVTEPWERLFNLNFWSPLYSILFNNEVNVDAKITSLFDLIERFTSVTVDRENANVEVDTINHAVSLQIPYWMDNQTIYHVFSRVISK